MNSATASTGYTYEFVRRSLPQGARQILEVGCGAGEVAALLIGDGLEVTAIDADAEQTDKARAAGVHALNMVWPARLDQRFDAVLFTRSLHHVDDLAGGIEAARAVLRPGGRIIVEDFRAEGGSERSAAWFSALVDALAVQGKITPGAREETLEQAAPSSTHDHHLHSSAEIARALGRLTAVSESEAAYYFRYVEPRLCEPDHAKHLLELELDLIEQGTIDALGKRFVAEDR